MQREKNISAKFGNSIFGSVKFKEKLQLEFT